MRKVLIIGVTALTLGCNPSEPPPTEASAKHDATPCPNDLSAEVTELKKRISILEQENADLKLTPSAIGETVRRLLSYGDVSQASAQLDLLKERYPGTKEITLAEKEIAAYVAKQRAEEIEAERRKLLGFKALGTNTVVETNEAKVTIESIKIASNWIFDNYGHEYSYREAARESRFIVLSVAAATKGSNDPGLPGFAAYVQKGDKLKRVGVGGYKFVRWMDYGSYLGNGHDFRNDFRPSAKIPFSYGIEVSKSDLKQPVLIVGTRDGCFSRTTSQFDRPPVAYVGDWTRLKDELTLSDFDNGELVVVKILERSEK